MTKNVKINIDVIASKGSSLNVGKVWGKTQFCKVKWPVVFITVVLLLHRILKPIDCENKRGGRGVRPLFHSFETTFYQKENQLYLVIFYVSGSSVFHVFCGQNQKCPKRSLNPKHRRSIFHF